MNISHMKYGSLFAVTLLVSTCVFSQKENLNRVVAGFPVNYEEENVGKYTLPYVLTLRDGTKVQDAKTWTEKRRPEIIKLYEEQQFGKMRPEALRKQVTVYFTKDTSSYKMALLIYLPAKAGKPSPLLLMANFSANSTAVDDPGVKAGYVRTREGKRVPAGQSRGFGKINVESFISQVIGVATVCYGDIEPDFRLGYKLWHQGQIPEARDERTRCR